VSAVTAAAFGTAGEVMLRLDPGDERISTTRTSRAWEGGGEYNVAPGPRRSTTYTE
jgi:hypothetical protein